MAKNKRSSEHMKRAIPLLGRAETRVAQLGLCSRALKFRGCKKPAGEPEGKTRRKDDIQCCLPWAPKWLVMALPIGCQLAAIPTFKDDKQHVALVWSGVPGDDDMLHLFTDCLVLAFTVQP